MNNHLLFLRVHATKSVETETNLTSIERLIEFAKLKNEKDTVIQAQNKIKVKHLRNYVNNDQSVSTIDMYSNNGSISFKNVSLRYSESGQTVLKGIQIYKA